MDIVKKNLVSIIFGVLALAAVIAVFVWPLGGYVEDLKGKVAKRAAMQSKIQGLLSKARSAPVVDPTNPTPVKLTKFPSGEILKKGKQAQTQVHEESVKMYDMAVGLNRKGHGLVVEGTLPVPINQPLAIKFRSQLQDALTRLRTEQLKAGVPPTPEELNNRADQIWKGMEKEIITVNGQPTNQDQVMARYEAALAKLPKEMKDEMATKFKMYIDPATVMKVPPSLPADGNSPNPTQIWWSQVAFWITSDVASAIMEVNANSTSVTDSPVKNLIALTIPEDFFPALGQAPVAADADASATPAGGGLPDPTLTLPDASAQSPTRRMSNNLFDVIQFKMTVDVEADKVSAFLKTLATNRFITVTRFELNPVDTQKKQIDGYVYGTRPVVTLDLDCEALLMREWTRKLMPAALRKLIGIPDSAVGTAAPVAPVRGLRQGP